MRPLSRTQKRAAIAVLIAIAGAGTALAVPPGSGTGGQKAAPNGAGGSGGDAAAVATSTTTTTTTTTSTSTAAVPGGEAAPEKTTATIVFTVTPTARATVMWGKTVLGRIAPGAPLVVRRPRDSGPLDVSVIAAGYLTVHTRAYTFADSRVSVKLTTLDQKPTLFGYRAPLDAGVPSEDALNAPPASAAGVDVLQQPPL